MNKEILKAINPSIVESLTNNTSTQLHDINDITYDEELNAINTYLMNKSTNRPDGIPQEASNYISEYIDKINIVVSEALANGYEYEDIEKIVKGDTVIKKLKETIQSYLKYNN